MTENSTSHSIIIIGAGLAGLTAALHLAERGLKPLVLEAGSHVGGRLAGGEEISINGATFRLEHGVHGTQNLLMDLYDELHAMIRGADNGITSWTPLWCRVAITCYNMISLI